MSTDNDHQKEALSSKSLTPEQFANQALTLQQQEEELIDSTGVKITELKTGENNDCDNFTGTNGKIVFRKINLHTYNGPKQEDFFEIAKSYCDATLKELEVLENKIQNPEKLKKIQEKKEAVKKKIEKFNDEIKFLFPNIPPANQTTVEKLSENIETATKKLNILVGNFAFLIEYDDKADMDKQTLADLIEKRGLLLREKVKNDIKENGRSNSYHLYEVPGSAYNQKAQRASIVTTIGEKTVPSSIRDGKGVPLANFVRRTYAKVNQNESNEKNQIDQKNQNQNDERNQNGPKKNNVHVQFSGLTHSSYPPVDLFPKSRFEQISIETEIRVREIAIKGVEAVLQEFAKQAIAEGKPLDPIEINLTTLSLLTPILSKAIEHFTRPSVSESRQIKEVILALNMCRSKKEIKITGENGQEKTFNIKLNMTHMNMPTNLGTIKKPYLIASSNKYNKQINARGFNDFCSNIENFTKNAEKGSLKDIGNEFFIHARDVTNAFKLPHPEEESEKLEDEKDEKIKKLEARLKKLHDKYMKDDDSDAVELKYEKNKKVIQRKIDRLKDPKSFANIVKRELDDAYKKLAEIQAKLQKNTNQKEDVKTYKKTLQEIKILEREHRKALEVVNDQYKSNFIKKEKQAEAALIKLEQKGFPEGSAEKEFIDTCRLVFNARKIYHHQTYKDSEHAYDFQPLYLLSNARMGRSVEWFCKSAEDRSGVTGDRVEELLAFRDHKGRFPSTEEDRKWIKENLSHPIHNGSINRQVNNDNDPGSRGMQVKSEFGGEHLHFSEIDRKMSKIPKAIAALKPNSWKNMLHEEPEALLKDDIENAENETKESLRSYSENTEDETKESLKKNTQDDKRNPEKQTKNKVKNDKSKNSLSEQLESATNFFKTINSLTEKGNKIAETIEKNPESVVAQLEQFSGYELFDKKEESKRKEYFENSKKALSKMKKGEALVNPKKRKQYLETAQENLKTLTTQFSTPELKSSIGNYYQSSKTRTWGSLKTIAKPAIPVSVESFKEITEKTTENLNRQGLLKGVFGKKDPITGAMTMLVPPKDFINSSFNSTSKAVEVNLSAESDQTILLALETNKEFAPLVIEFPQGKNSNNIEDVDVVLVLKTMMAGKLKGIEISVDESFRTAIEEKYKDKTPNRFNQLKQIENLSESSSELKTIRQKIEETTKKAKKNENNRTVMAGIMSRISLENLIQDKLLPSHNPKPKV